MYLKRIYLLNLNYNYTVSKKKLEIKRIIVEIYDTDD